MREINEIIVHCTATRPGWRAEQTTAERVAEVRRWHVDGRGWRDIGYHYLIDRDGTVANGRHVAQVGAHCRGRNTGSIGVSLFGGHGSAETDKFADNFTAAQDRALRALISGLQAEHGPLTVTGHNEHAAKACPGFNVAEWLTGRRPAPEEPPKQSSKAAAVAVVAGGAAVVGWWDKIIAFLGFGG